MYHHIMSFRWDTDVGVFLFPGLNINGSSALIALCVVLLVISLIYEAVKVFQTSSKARTARERLRSASSTATETTNLLLADQRSSQGSSPGTKKFFDILGQAVIFLFQNVVSYLLMLSVMVYNIYVFIAVVLGMGLGYFLFGHISMRINMENIRARTTNALCTERNPLEIVGPSTSRNLNENQHNQSNGSIESVSTHQQSEADVHPCVGAQDTDNLHTCRL